MATSNTFPIKFTADGLAEVLQASQKVKRSYLDWLESAEKAIEDANKGAKQFAADQEKLEQFEKDRARAAQNANRAVEASYRELGVKSTRSIEEQKNRAISAYEALKKSGVASARDLEVAAEKLQARLAALDGELQSVDKTTQQTGEGLQFLSRTFAGFIANISASAFQNILQSLKQFALGVINTRTELSKLRDQLSLLEGSDAKGALAFDKLSEFAKTTPFEINEVTQAYVSLGNRGIKPTTTQLKDLGNLALSQKKSLNQLVEAVLDAQTGENERLKEFGIRAEKSGDRVKFSFKGITKEVALTEKAVLEALVAFGQVDGVAGSIEKASNRLDGVGSNIADSFTRIQDAIGGALEPLLVAGGKGLSEFLGPLSDPALWAPVQDAFNEILAVFQTMGPEAEELRLAFQEGLRAAVEVVATMLLQIAEVLRENPVLISQTVDSVKFLIEVIGAVLLLITQVIAGVVQLTGWFTSAASIFKETLGAAIAEYPQAWNNAVGGIEAIWTQFIQSILGVWRQLVGAFESAKAYLEGPFTGPLKTVWDIVKNILSAINGWINPIEKALKPLREFQSLLSKILGNAVEVGEDTGKKLERGSGGPLLMAAPGSAFHPSKFPVTSRFGMRGGRLHAGTDYGTPEGTPLANIFGPGVVTLAGDVGGYGNLIELTLANGDVYRFGHLSQILVRQGQVVPAGALMGLTGNTGRSTGAHLHLEYYPGGGAPVDFEGHGSIFGSGFNALGLGRGGPSFAAVGVKAAVKSGTTLAQNSLEQLKAKVEEFDRLRTLAGLETTILTGQAVGASQYQRDRLQIERRIIEEQADFARQLAQLRAERSQAKDEDQREYVDQLIDKYSELNKVNLTNLTSELTKLDDANAESLRLAKQTTPALKEVAEVVSQSLRELPDLLVGVLTGTQNLGDGILGFLSGLASKIGGLFLDKGFGLLDKAIGGLFDSKTPKFAMGGIVPGYGGGDRVPAFLEPGEAILRKEVVSALGRNVINNLNGGNTSQSTKSLVSSVTINYNIPSPSPSRPTRRQLTQDLVVATQRYGRF